MFSPCRYIGWIRRFYGKLPFDLVSSGLATVSAHELGAPPLTDDPAAWGRLRGAIARYHGVSEPEVVATLGTTQALWLVYTGLLAPGDEVLIEWPAYEPLWHIAEGIGASPVFFRREASRNWAVDPDAVGRAITPRTRLIVLTNLHNPTGVRTPDAVIAELARIAASRDVHLLVDEVYGPFDRLVDDAGVFHGSARKLGEHVLTCGSLTKCYGLGPERIGWVVGPPAVIARLEDVMTATCGMLPFRHANEGVHAFANLGALAARARRLLGDKRAKVARWVASRPDLAWSAPQEGLFGFAQARRDEDLTPAIEAGAASLGVAVAPGAFFGIPNGFRLAWSLPEEKLEEALARLGQALPVA